MQGLKVYLRQISIGLLFWKPCQKWKKKNTKDITKSSQYNVIMTIIDEFQQFNLFVFELNFL